MSNETFFRMLSIALLGAVALAFIPDSQATGLSHIVFAEDPMEIEIQSVQEVQEINAGRFNPAIAGDLTDYANSQDKTEITALAQPGR